MKVRKTALDFGIAALLVGAAFLFPGFAQAGPVGSPGSFDDDFEGSLASSGSRLYFVSTGMDEGGPMEIQLQVYAGKGWERVGKRIPTTSGYPVNVAVAGRGSRTYPCVSDVRPDGRARIRCHRGGRWHSIEIGPGYRGKYVKDMIVRRGRLMALMTGWQGSGAKTIAKALPAELVQGAMVPYASAISLRGQYWFGFADWTRGSRPAIDIEVKSANSGRFWIQRIAADGSRSRSPELNGVEWGPWGSSPVRRGKRIFVAVNQDISSDDGSEGSTSVFSFGPGGWARVGDGPVSSGVGYSQGGVHAVGEHVWTVWQESETAGTSFGDRFPTRIRAARINEAGTGYDKWMELWEGKLYFPGPTSATSYRGAPVFMYPRQFGDDKGLHLTVDLNRVP